MKSIQVSILINHFISCHGGIIDSEYREIVNVIMKNHGKVPYEIFVGQRIAQIIFHKIEQVAFVKVDTLSKTERQCDDFGSTGY